MSQPIDRAHAEGFSPTPPQQPPSRTTWDSEPLREGLDHWRYARRVDLASLAVPFVVSLVHGSDAALATDEAWREDPRERDKILVERAVGLARLLQDAVDRARPRT